MDKKLQDTYIANLSKFEIRINEFEAVQQRHISAQQKKDTQLESILEEQIYQAFSLKYAHADVKVSKATCREMRAKIAISRFEEFHQKEIPNAKPQPGTKHGKFTSELLQEKMYKERRQLHSKYITTLGFSMPDRKGNN